MKKKTLYSFFGPYKTSSPVDSDKGFTMVELLISISIIVIISSIAVFNQQRFSEVMAISNVAYDVAITLRQAQVYALSGWQPNLFTEPYVPSYGIRFSQGSSSFQLMADTNNNGTLNQVIENLTLQRGVVVSDLCLANQSGGCVQSAPNLSVYFIRPRAQAFFSLSGGQNALITLQSPNGLEKGIFITESGQILVR